MAHKKHFFDTTKLPVVYPPGETLEEKLLEMGMDIKDFASAASLPEATVTSVIHGVCVITPDMAVSFENVTKIPAYLWLRLQESYDRYKARSKPPYSESIRKRLKNSLIRGLNNSASIAP